MPSVPVRYGDALADLHQRYAAVTRARPLPALAREIGISTLTLHRFEREGYVSALALHQIATWTQAQERVGHQRNLGGYER